MCNNLSEEEIIEVLQRVISANRFDGLYTSIGIIIDAIQGLLYLYNKEKEKNKELRQYKLYLIKEHNVVKMKDVEEELLSMRNALEQKQVEMEMQNNIIDICYISKDKIKSKIKELNNECDDCRYKKIIDCTKHCNFYLTRITLQELLEGYNEYRE